MSFTGRSTRHRRRGANKSYARHFVYIFGIMALMPLQTLAKVETVDVTRFIETINTEHAAQIIDVRPTQTRETAYIRNSISIPLEALSSRMGEIDFTKPVLVYCQTGRRSAEAMKILSSKDPLTLVELQGGIVQFLGLLSSEPEALKNMPGRKALYDKARNLLVVGSGVVGLHAPELSFKDDKGKTVTSSSLKGKPYILAFIAAPEIKQADEILEFKNRYEKKKSGIRILPIAVYQTEEEKNVLTKHLKDKKIKTAFYYDETAVAARKMSLTGLPGFSLIDASGVIRANNISNAEGPVDACGNKTLDEMAAMVASGKLPPYPLSAAELADMRQMKMVGSIAPDFTLPDYNGTKHTLSDVDDNGALVVFGTLRCPYTVKELKTANECDKTLNGKPVKVLAVLMVPDAQETQRVKEFTESERIKYPLLMDSDGSIFAKYNISSVPVWWVVGPDGSIKHREVGFSDATCDKIAGALPK